MEVRGKRSSDGSALGRAAPFPHRNVQPDRLLVERVERPVMREFGPGTDPILEIVEDQGAPVELDHQDGVGQATFLIDEHDEPEVVGAKTEPAQRLGTWR